MDFAFTMSGLIPKIHFIPSLEPKATSFVIPAHKGTDT